MSAATLRALLDERSDTSPEAPCLIDPASSTDHVSYRQVRDRAAAVAGRLGRAGVRPGESIAYAMGNGVDCALCVLGILYGGYRAVAVNLVAGSATVGYVLAHSETRLVLTEASHRPLIETALNEPSVEEFRCEGQPEPVILEVDGDFTSAMTGDADPQPLTRESDGLLMYTSGTTGRPKGVVLTHANLLAGGHNTATAHRLTRADRALCVLPLFHINGLCVTLMAPLVSGGSVVLPTRFSASRFWQWTRAHACTWFSVVPTQIAYLLHDKTEVDTGKSETLRFGRSASAPLSPDVHRAFEARFGLPLIETMGLTETAAQILSNPMPPGERKLGSPGVPFGCEAIVADERHHEVARGTEGELLIRGTNVMSRYLKNPDETTRSITADGWLCTGDLARMDEDGYLFITGRLKELIIKGGENIAPREIDDALYQHEAVIEAAAFACPCDDYGERVEAAVRLRPDSTVTEAELLTLCEKRVGAFKKPDRIHLLDELPKGPSGKIQRLRIAEIITTKS